MPPIIIGSRKSDLALWQALEVLTLLHHHHHQHDDHANGGALPPNTFSIRTELSQGDISLDKSLSTLAAGNPGLFTKELEVGLLSGGYTLAVHSLKDMPTTLPPGLCLSGICAREDPRDAVVMSARHAATGLTRLEDLPPGSVVGTSSLRREAFLRRCHPHLTSALVRGNLNTRLRKLDATPEGVVEPSPSSPPSDAATTTTTTHYDALLLASAGMHRMGWGARISCYPTLEDCPYGVGQGALGIETRDSDDLAKGLARQVTHPPTALRCLCERAFLRALQGGCQIPIGVHTTLSSKSISAAEAAVAAAASSSMGGGGGGGAEHRGEFWVGDVPGAQQQGPTVCTLTLTGTVTSLDGSQTVTISVTEVVSVPKGKHFKTVNTHGLEKVHSAVRVALEGGGEELTCCTSSTSFSTGDGGSSGSASASGSQGVWLGVSEEEWNGMVEVAEGVGKAGAARILASRGGRAIMDSLGFVGGVGATRPITYSETLKD